MRKGIEQRRCLHQDVVIVSEVLCARRSFCGAAKFAPGMLPLVVDSMAGLSSLTMMRTTRRGLSRASGLLALMSSRGRPSASSCANRALYAAVRCLMASAGGTT